MRQTNKRRVARRHIKNKKKVVLPVLSVKEGGTANVKTYCKYYHKRPLDLSNMILCSGSGFCEPCTDLYWCLNKEFSDKDPQSLSEGEIESDVVKIERILTITVKQNSYKVAKITDVQ